MVSRYLGAWWDSLVRDTLGVVEDFTDDPVLLGTGLLEVNERATHYSAAVEAFASRLDRPESEETRAPDLGDPAFENPLLVHMHALLDLLNSAPGAGSDVRAQVLDGILNLERTRWQAPADRHVAPPPAVQHKAVTVALLVAGTSREDLAGALGAIPDLSDVPVGHRLGVADWVHNLYQNPVPPPWVYPLGLGLLKEQLLATCPDLTELVARCYEHVRTTPARVAHLLDELVRADHRPPVGEALDGLLADRLPDAVTHALEGSAAADRFPDLLADALTLHPQPSAAAACAGLLPTEHCGVSVRRLAATVTGQQVAYYRSQASSDPNHHSDLAMSLNNLSIRLADLGRPEQALHAITEATALYRDLAQARPDAYTPDLARSLNNLSGCLADLGRPEQALHVVADATALYRDLAQARPDAYTPDLAGSLNNLSGCLADLGRPEQALHVVAEATELYHDLAQARPGVYGPALTRSLNNLADLLDGCGRHDDAEAARAEAAQYAPRS